MCDWRACADTDFDSDNAGWTAGDGGESEGASAFDVIRGIFGADDS